MAQKVRIELVDDLDQSEADETVTFALDGTSYEIDLSEKNASALRQSLEPYVAAARKVSSSRGGRRAGARSASPNRDPKAIREWAQANGYDVPARGRIPAEVEQAYNAAN